MVMNCKGVKVPLRVVKGLVQAASPNMIFLFLFLGWGRMYSNKIKILNHIFAHPEVV